NAARHAGSKVWMSLREEGPWVVLRVSDDGAGVAESEAESIFDWNYRGAAGTRRRGGSGIGLALARAIVQRHGGSIGVAPAAASGGACFWFTLPVADLS
ncbi:MAG: ATP-binding protein, partial [Myxococcales bacterium]|nr:ATP-binding protein [Myxococcales bacterium]